MILSELRKPKELRARQPSITLHHLASAAGSAWRPPARHNRTMSSSTCAQSPTMPRSILTFLLIDVDVDLLRLRRKGVKAAGDAIVETRADANHQIAVMHGAVGLERAVHAEH